MEVLINIDVPDLERAVRFYEQALGLKLKRKLFEDSVAEMGGAAVPIYLVTKSENSEPFPDSPAGRSYRRHWTPLHPDFVVDDLVASIARAEAAGANLESGPESFAWGSIASFSDPFGHGWCLLQWSGKGYDEEPRRLPGL